MTESGKKSSARSLVQRSITPECAEWWVAESARPLLYSSFFAASMIQHSHTEDSMTPKELLPPLHEALDLRAIQKGQKLISEHIDLISAMDPKQEGAALLIGHLAKWIDVDFSLLTRVENLVNGPFRLECRPSFAFRDVLYLRLADAIAKMHRAAWAVAIPQLEFLLSAQVEDVDLFMSANYFMARCYRNLGQYTRARDCALQAKQLAEGRGAQLALINILEAWLLFQDGNHSDAGRLLDAAESKLADDPLSMGNILFARARMARREGHDEYAMQFFAEAIAQYRTLEAGATHPNLARTLANLALTEILMARKKRLEAEEGNTVSEAYCEVLDVVERTAKELEIKGVEPIVQKIQFKIDSLNEKRHDSLFSALAALAREIRAKINAELEEENFRGVLGRRMKRSGEFDCKELLSLRESIGNFLKGLESLPKKGPQVRHGQVGRDCDELAAGHLAEAKSIYEALGHSRGIGTCHLRSGLQCVNRQQFGPARDEAEAAYKLGEANHDNLLMGRARVMQCYVENEFYELKAEAARNDAVAQRRAEAAHRYASEALALSASTENPALNARANMMMAYILSNKQSNKFRDAWRHYQHASDVIEKAHLTSFQEDLRTLADRILKAGVAKSELREWLLTPKGKTLEELKNCIYTLVWEHERRKVERVAENLGVSYNAAREHLSKLDLHHPPIQKSSKSVAAGD